MCVFLKVRGSIAEGFEEHLLRLRDLTACFRVPLLVGYGFSPLLMINHSCSHIQASIDPVANCDSPFLLFPCPKDNLSASDPGEPLSGTWAPRTRDLGWVG